MPLYTQSERQALKTLAAQELMDLCKKLGLEINASEALRIAKELVETHEKLMIAGIEDRSRE